VRNVITRPAAVEARAAHRPRDDLVSDRLNDVRGWPAGKKHCVGDLIEGGAKGCAMGVVNDLNPEMLFAQEESLAARFASEEETAIVSDLSGDVTRCSADLDPESRHRWIPVVTCLMASAVQRSRERDLSVPGPASHEVGSGLSSDMGNALAPGSACLTTHHTRIGKGTGP
jgi:hypothetical protein